MGFPFDRGHGWGSCPQDWQGNQHHHCYHHPHQCYYHSPKKNQQKSTIAKQVLGLGTPASNAGLKAGDVLVQVELHFRCWWLLNFISNAEQWTLSFISNADKWAESKDDNDVWCWSAETVCKENYTSSKFHFLLIKMMILIKLMLMQVESKLVTMLTHPEAVQCIRSSNVNEEL